MNPYFWFFSLWALWITPAALEVSLRMEKDVYVRLRLRVGNLPLWRSGGEDDAQNTERAAGSELMSNARLIWTLWRDGSIRRAMRCLHPQTVHLHARLSFRDAALTAMQYALVRTVLETLARCGALPRSVTGRVEADFQGQGTQVSVQCIFVSRLGILGVAAARLGWAALRARARLSLAEEEKYAASH